MKNYLDSSPVKWLIGYSIIILIISSVVFFNQPKEISKNNNQSIALNDSLSNKNIKVIEAKNEIEAEKNDTLYAHKSEVKEEAEHILLKFAEKNEAILFRDLDYQYSIDYQVNLIKKNVIFHFFIEDIFKEKKSIFIKGRKIISNLNVFLKLKCNNYSIEELKSYKFYIYVCAKISSIEKILFNAAAKVEKENRSDNEALITLDTMDEGLLVSGDCIDILPNNLSDQ